MALTYAIIRLGFAPAVGLWLKYDYLTAPLFIAAVCYATWRAREARGASGVLTVFMLCVSVLVLVAMWQAGASDWQVIGGLLPYSDARDYYTDALRLLHGQKFSEFSSRRPLFPAFLAGLLYLTDLDLRVTLILLTAISVVAICFAAREAQRTLGLGAGALMLLCLFIFYRRFIGATLTEHLGLAFGCLAFALLWRGAGGDRPGPVLFGLFLLSLGLNARAGAFLILPALVLWAVWAYRGPTGSTLRTLVGGIAAVGLAFGLNGILLHALGVPGAAYSNFSYTLYGLVSGGNWSLALQRHPELASLAPLEQTTRIYSLAWEQIQAHPLTLVSGTVRAWTAFFGGRSGTWVSHIFYPGPDPADLRRMLLAEGVSALTFRRDVWILLDGIARQIWVIGLNALLIVGAVVLWRNRQRPVALLLIAAWAGMLLSVPFVPPWDADNMRAYAATLPFIIGVAAMALSSWRGGPGAQGDRGCAGAPRPVLDLLVFSAILLGMQVLGPLSVVLNGTAQQFRGPVGSCPVGCERPGQARLLYLDPRNAIHLVGSPEGPGPDWKGNVLSLPDLRERILLRDYPDVWHQWRGLSRLPRGTTLAVAYDLQRGNTGYIQSGSTTFPRSPAVLAICGEVVRDGWIEHLRADPPAVC
jgi:hypothetical protein